jgi:hypothetical protein
MVCVAVCSIFGVKNEKHPKTTPKWASNYSVLHIDLLIPRRLIQAFILLFLGLFRIEVSRRF